MVGLGQMISQKFPIRKYDYLKQLVMGVVGTFHFGTSCMMSLLYQQDAGIAAAESKRLTGWVVSL